MATITQIAARLNLNKSTVSRALNNRPVSMSDDTRQEILRVAREIGYVPNPAARSLTAARSGNIGLVSRKFNNALYTALLLELAVAVDNRGGNLVSCVTGREAEHHGQEHLLHTGAVDGLLAFPYALPGLDRPGSPWMRRPIVFLLSVWEENLAPSVRFDDRDGARQVAQHLWELGHRKLLLIQGVGPNNVSSTFGVERYVFLREAWATLGGDGDRDIAERAAQATAEGGYEAMQGALAAGEAGPSDDRPDAATAIVTYSDQMAQGALRALHEKNVRVPDDVSVVGWNDLDDTAQFLTPALTTVRTSPRELAEAALDLLYRHIEGHDKNADTAPDAPEGEDAAPSPPPDRVRVPVRLVVRESTRAVAPLPGSPRPAH